MIVAFIGMGTMGAAAAHNVLKAGFPLIVHDLKQSAAAPLLVPSVRPPPRPRDESVRRRHDAQYPAAVDVLKRKVDPMRLRIQRDRMGLVGEVLAAEESCSGYHPLIDRPWRKRERWREERVVAARRFGDLPELSRCSTISRSRRCSSRGCTVSHGG